MKIQLKEITIRELSEGYVNNEERGVRGYGGKLDIRPPYQREFIYGDQQRSAVIDTVKKDYPLNVMYWADRQDGTYEVIDGQQRTISICQYIDGLFSNAMFYFHSLTDDEQEQILNYKLMVYICTGGDREKLKWFETINIAGVELSPQELKNAVYSGSWVTDAKRYFSKKGCVAYQIGNQYLNRKVERQEYLETAIDWKSNGNIVVYMGQNQHEPNANELWLYFQAVISWVKTIFPKYYKEMKGVQWGFLYNEFKDEKLDTKKLEAEVSELMSDEDVTSKKGIFKYVLTRKEKFLNIRAFDDKEKREAYQRQKGICPVCEKEYTIEEMEADHILPWSKGGKTNAKNCQMLCREDNRFKSGK